MKFAWLLAFLFFSIEPVWACRCVEGAIRRLGDQADQARIAMLIKLEKSAEEKVPPKVAATQQGHKAKVQTLAWTTESITHWQDKGSSCDLRPQEDIWYVMVSNAPAGSWPMACNSILTPVTEAGELIATLSKKWSPNRPSPNPAWSTGCSQNKDCVVSPKSSCIGTLAIHSKHKAAVNAWRKTIEPKLNCVGGSDKEESVKAICHTGVCELR